MNLNNERRTNVVTYSMVWVAFFVSLATYFVTEACIHDTIVSLDGSRQDTTPTPSSVARIFDRFSKIQTLTHTGAFLVASLAVAIAWKNRNSMSFAVGLSAVTFLIVCQSALNHHLAISNPLISSMTEAAYRTVNVPPLE